mgnify:CR=1 FL=1
MTQTEILTFKKVLLSTFSYEVHHESTERGYTRVDCCYVERYIGRFGRGFKLHYPSASGKSNRYAPVEYIIEK